MNHYSGMEMAKRRQAEFQREANLHCQMRAAKIEPKERTTRFPWLLPSRRAAGGSAETPRIRREWRLSHS
jgi:hypothetical protein